MSPLAVRQAFVVARRDFTAKVWTPIFLIMLILPIVLSFVGIGAMSGLQGGMKDVVKERSVVMVTDAETGRRASAAADRERRFMGEEGSSNNHAPRLVVTAPDGPPARQLERLIARADGQVGAVSFDGRDGTRVYSMSNRAEALYLIRMRREAAHETSPHPVTFVRHQQPIAGKLVRTVIAYGVVLLMIMLNQLFASQTTSSLIEERSSRLIDSLAAAAPLESVLFGKVMADFAATGVFVGVYASLLVLVPPLLPSGVSGVLGQIGIEAGWSTLILFGIYFATLYLITSITLVTLTSLASTPQAARMASLPGFIGQTVAAGLGFWCMQDVHSAGFVVAAIVPFTSPIVMLGGHLNGVSPYWHVAAIIWQVVCVIVMLRIAAVTFRRTALNSSSASTGVRRKRRNREEAIAIPHGKE
jgi:ABC-2 type transport system permease protein